MKLTLGFSPCPNDTFIFDALVNNRFEHKAIEFEPVIKDVEELNQMAAKNVLDISKISFHAFSKVWRNYKLLDSGSALGWKSGPLLISKSNYNLHEIRNLKIAIPGRNTTANLVFSIAFPEVKNIVPMLFSEIENAVVAGEVDAGLIIHESRFTYQKKGLIKIIDLGEFWENETHLPVPLGGIAVKRNLNIEIQKKINHLVKESLLLAFQHPDDSKSFTKKYAQQTDDEVIEKHIALYVNDFSINLGSIGRKAIEVLYQKAFENRVIDEIPQDIFI